MIGIYILSKQIIFTESVDVIM